MELFELLCDLFLNLWHIILHVGEDQANRNDRGKGKRPSNKYVV